jgi:hypothetical protein
MDGIGCARCAIEVLFTLTVLISTCARTPLNPGLGIVEGRIARRDLKSPRAAPPFPNSSGEETWQPWDWKLTARKGSGEDAPWTVDLWACGRD